MSGPRAVLTAALGARASDAAASLRRVTDAARIGAFEGLRAAGDLGAIVLFLDLNRARPGVLDHVWSVAPELPTTTQCALVSLDDGEPPHAEIAARLHPAARVLLLNPRARARDRGFYAALAASLRAQRTRLPQIPEPASVAPTP